MNKFSRRVVSAFTVTTMTYLPIAQASYKQALNSNDINKYASAVLSDQGNLQSLKVITDNKEAFLNKLRVIESAKKNLDLVYYIFSDDRSSSELAQKVVEAAGRGVQVQLLVDLHTNYSRLDYFTMLEKRAARAAAANKSNGSLTVKFYNRPTRNQILDATFMTTGCGDSFYDDSSIKSCSNVKLGQIDELYGEDRQAGSIKGSDAYYDVIPQVKTKEAQMFLSGIYSKDPDVLKKAIIEGQQIDVKQLLASFESQEKEMKSESAKEIAQDAANQMRSLLEFGEMVWIRKTDPNPFVRFFYWIKVSLAYLFYGDELRPIVNKVNGILPIETKRSTAYSVRKEILSADRSHLTDFTHHKLVMADYENVQLGGRNVEDSYHTNNPKLVDKYLFKDVDASVVLKQPNMDLKKSYDRLFNHKGLTVGTQWLRANIPNDFAANLSIARNECKEEKLNDISSHGLTREERIKVSRRVEERSEYNRTCQADETLDPMAEDNLKPVINKYILSCYKEKVATNSLSVNQREALAEKNLEDQISLYAKTQLKDQDPVEAQSIAMSAHELSQAKVGYMENLPFTKEDPSKRLYGVEQFEEAKSGKYIHELLIRGLKKVCASKGKNRRVILHNAYFAPPANMLDTFASMVDGSWNCQGVTVDVLTNSFSTTDLSPVNAVSRHAMQAFFEYYKKFESKYNGAKFRIFEYQKDLGRSLHAKVSVLGNDIVIGSANMDLRSFLMDTNNGIYIQNAPELVSSYVATVDSVLSNPKVTQLENDYYANKTGNAEILAEDKQLFDCSILKYSTKDKLNLPAYLAAKKYILQISNMAYKLTSEFIGNYEMQAKDYDERMCFGSTYKSDGEHCPKENSVKKSPRRQYDERLQTI
ncbi:MAG: hypothetical protein KDD50_12815 [Bdellovibrionales bacterium]|nr:hypothetical protein [Bdellovibrionales bacterium]